MLTLSDRWDVTKVTDTGSKIVIISPVGICGVIVSWKMKKRKNIYQTYEENILDLDRLFQFQVLL